MSIDSYIIVDLDGTLFNTSARIHHLKPIAGTKKNWKAFFAGIPDDPINTHVREVVDLLASRHKVLLITGRPENTQRATLEALDKYHFRFDTLLMRPNNDNRHDYEVKRDLFLDLGIPTERVFCAFEDRLQVVSMWKNLGIPVFVCGDEYENNPAFISSPT